MSRKFKTRKNITLISIKFILFLTIVLCVILLVFNVLYEKLTKAINENEVIDIMLNNNPKEFKSIFSKNGLSFIVNYTLGINLDKEDNVKKTENTNNITTDETVIKEENYDSPLIYIYNTHQTEEYQSVNTNEYNVTPTVLHASLILQNKLSDLGIQAIVEKNDIKEILNINGWNYRSSYKASKMLASDTLSKNPTIKYVIDLHRDSIPLNIAKVTIDGKDYAKIMIVLGKGHDGYERNLEMANRINNYLKEFNPLITRGIDIKINSGIFNQDISSNAVLIEVGGPYNDINSVKNSLEILANVYKRIVDEDNEKEET